jgi:hypothetical protein
MQIRRASVAVVGLLMGWAGPAVAQRTTMQPDSAKAQIRGVLRAFYFNLESRNWEALAAYVLSPKLLERRGAPGDLDMVARDRTRTRAPSHPAARSATCRSSAAPEVKQAVMQLDGDWAEVSVPRCLGTSAGTDEFRLLYFEDRWRFIYTALFEAPTNVSSSR